MKPAVAWPSGPPWIEHHHRPLAGEARRRQAAAGPRSCGRRSSSSARCCCSAKLADVDARRRVRRASTAATRPAAPGRARRSGSGPARCRRANASSSAAAVERRACRRCRPAAAGAGSSCSVRPSNRRSSSRPSTLTRSAASAAVFAEARRRSTSHGMCARDARAARRSARSVAHQLAELAGAVADDEQARAVALKPAGEVRRRARRRRAPAAAGAARRWPGRAARPAIRWPRRSASARPACRPATRRRRTSRRRAARPACAVGLGLQRVDQPQRGVDAGARAALRRCGPAAPSREQQAARRCSQPPVSWRSSGSVSSVLLRAWPRSSRYSWSASLPPLLRANTM